MRLRKEESVFKIIALTLSASEASANSLTPESRSVYVALTDFQVLHQNNELIFKHNYGTDLVADDDRSLNPQGDTKILTVDLTQTGAHSKANLCLNNLLLIFESQACLQIIQNAHTLRNVVSKALPRLSAAKAL